MNSFKIGFASAIVFVTLLVNVGQALADEPAPVPLTTPLEFSEKQPEGDYGNEGYADYNYHSPTTLYCGGGFQEIESDNEFYYGLCSDVLTGSEQPDNSTRIPAYKTVYVDYADSKLGGQIHVSDHVVRVTTNKDNKAPSYTPVSPIDPSPPTSPTNPFPSQNSFTYTNSVLVTCSGGFQIVEYDNGNANSLTAYCVASVNPGGNTTISTEITGNGTVTLTCNGALINPFITDYAISNICQ